MDAVLKAAVTYWPRVAPVSKPARSRADYEQLVTARLPIKEMSVPKLLRELMGRHRLTQSQLPEIGPQSVVSAVLSGKRALNVRQIARLARRFKLSADVFMP